MILIDGSYAVLTLYIVKVKVFFYIFDKCSYGKGEIKFDPKNPA